MGEYAELTYDDLKEGMTVVSNQLDRIVETYIILTDWESLGGLIRGKIGRITKDKTDEIARNLVKDGGFCIWNDKDSIDSEVEYGVSEEVFL